MQVHTTPKSQNGGQIPSLIIKKKTAPVLVKEARRRHGQQCFKQAGGSVCGNSIHRGERNTNYIIPKKKDGRKYKPWENLRKTKGQRDLVVVRNARSKDRKEGYKSNKRFKDGT